MNCSCDEVLAMLHAFVDDEADESQCAQIRSHMAECAECDEHRDEELTPQRQARVVVAFDGKVPASMQTRRSQRHQRCS